MQLLVAYGLDPGINNDTPQRLARVAAHYGELCGSPVRRQGRDAARVGLHVWDATESQLSWRAWQEEPALAVATLHQPFGYERIIGERPLDSAGLHLARALLDRPHRVAELSPPFVIGALEGEQDRVTLITDALGLGRLFQLRFPGGWVWSNRPMAACLFGGVRASPDLMGWRTFAATGWFMGDQTPLEHVYAVPAGAQVGYHCARGRVESRFDALAEWGVNRLGNPLSEKRLDEIADALRSHARSLRRLWGGEMVVSLSGGRDSRMVAAAFMSEGLDVEFATDASEAGEGTIAEALVAALPKKVRHRVHRPEANGRIGASGEETPTLQRALGWHRLHEGLRPAAYLPKEPPSKLKGTPYLSVSGAGGDLTHGGRGVPDPPGVDELPLSERIEVFHERLMTKWVRRSGVSASSKDAAHWQVRRVLQAAAAAGMEDSKMRSYFYLADRLRRWGSTSESSGTVAPLLVPEYQRVVYDLTQEQRAEDAFPRALTVRLLPEWADIPYYERPPGESGAPLRPRLGLARDNHEISALVADPETWEDSYDVAYVRQAWRLLQRGEGQPFHEEILQRVIWRSVFDNYLAELNGEEAPKQSSASLGFDELTGKADRMVRGRRFAARALRKAARVVDGSTV